MEKIKSLIENPETHCLTLDYILNEYLPQWLTWEPETLWTTIKKTFGVTEIPLNNKTEINALKTLYTTEAGWTDWDIFDDLVQGLQGYPPDFAIAYKPELSDLYIAVNIMNKIRQHLFSEEVTGFIAASCLDEGILFVPPPLDFVQPKLEMSDYRCTNCGYAEVYDGSPCDNCGAPPSALIRIPRYFDWHEVEKKWNDLKANGFKESDLEAIFSGDSLIDYHIIKLVNAIKLMEENEQRFMNEKTTVIK
uniref:Uncharacterized protein n=1 Tax=Dictyoglomus turgidum TaxID=513050 RepID=A0A7C3SN31_9BACT